MTIMDLLNSVLGLNLILAATSSLPNNLMLGILAFSQSLDVGKDWFTLLVPICLFMIFILRYQDLSPVNDL